MIRKVRPPPRGRLASAPSTAEAEAPPPPPPVGDKADAKELGDVAELEPTDDGDTTMDDRLEFVSARRTDNPGAAWRSEGVGLGDNNAVRVIPEAREELGHNAGIATAVDVVTEGEEG